MLTSVLVVGGCGFLGHHIVSRLFQTAQVSVLDLRIDRNRFPFVKYYQGDISKEYDVMAILKQVKPQVIIHTASPTALANNISVYEKVNINGTRNLLECAQLLGVQAFIYTSSASVVHDSISDLIDADESLPVLRSPQQTEPYSHTKGVADDMVLASNRMDGSRMMTVSIRPAGMFGEGDIETLAKMINAAATGKTKIQIGNGKNLFDFTYVGNAADAHVQAMNALLYQKHSDPSKIDPMDRVDGEAFFVTNGEPIPFWEFTRAVGAAAGYPVKTEDVWSIPRGVGLAMGSIAEWLVWLTSLGKKKSAMTRNRMKYSSLTRTYRINKIRDRLSYEPRVGYEEGIKRGVEWYLAHLKKPQ